MVRTPGASVEQPFGDGPFEREGCLDQKDLVAFHYCNNLREDGR